MWSRMFKADIWFESLQEFIAKLFVQGILLHPKCMDGVSNERKVVQSLDALRGEMRVDVHRPTGVQAHIWMGQG